MNLIPTSLLWDMTVGAEDPTPFLNLLLRSGLLVASALFIGLVLRAKRPETRILVYRAALLGSLAMGMLVLAPATLSRVSRWNIALYSSLSESSAQTKVLRSTPQSGSHQKLQPNPIEAPQKLPLLISEATPRDNRVEGAITWLLLLWPAISLCLLSRLVWCHGAVLWMRRHSQPVQDQETLKLLALASSTIGVRQPRLSCSSKATAPFLCGIWRPSIVLPPDYAAHFDVTALSAIFLHEAAHIRSWDCAWTYLRRISCAVLWPQPLLWLLSRKMETVSEEASDLAVIEGGYRPRDYARYLVDLAESLNLSGTERAVGAGVMPRRSALTRRVEQILKGVPQTGRLNSKARWGAAVMTVGLGAAAASFAVDASTPLGAVGEIHGRVVYENGKPASGLGIEAEIQDDDDRRIRRNGNTTWSRRAQKMLAQGTTSGPDGTFRIKNLLAGATFNVMVHNGVLTPVGEAGPPGFVAAAQMVKPRQDATTRIRDIVLTRGALIEGHIEDSISGQPLANMSIGCHGPHRPPSTGFITSARSDSNGRFVLRVPPGRNWVYWNGPVESLRAEVHFGSSSPHEKDLEVTKSGSQVYGKTDFVEVRVDDGAPRYTRSGNGGLRDADEILLKAGQTRRMTFRLTQLRMKERPGKVPLVKLGGEPPLPGAKPIPWNPGSTLPLRGTGTLTGKVFFPNGKAASSVSLIIQMQNRAVEALPDAPAVYTPGFDRLPRAQSRMLKQNTVTSADGTYKVTGLLDAPYDILFTPDEAGSISNWIAPPLSAVLVRQGQLTRAPDIVLQHGALIRGQVKDAQSSQGIDQGFLVVKDGRRPPSVGMAELFDADKWGRFSFRVLPGMIDVRLNFMSASMSNTKKVRLGTHFFNLNQTMISADGRLQKIGSVARVTVREGQTTTLNFQLPRSPER